MTDTLPVTYFEIADHRVYGVDGPTFAVANYIYIPGRTECLLSGRVGVGAHELRVEKSEPVLVIAKAIHASKVPALEEGYKLRNVVRRDNVDAKIIDTLLSNLEARDRAIKNVNNSLTALFA